MFMKGFDVMASKKYKNKPSIKNIVIGLCVIIGIIFLLLYFYKWHQVKEDEKYLNSYLISSSTISLEMNDLSEIRTVLSEAPTYYFIYISYTGDKNIYDFEKKLKPLIDDYAIQNNFYYLNVTEIKNKNENYKKDIAKELDIEEKKISDVPIILYFKNGELVNSGITSVNDFKDLLEKHDMKSM